MGIKNDEMQLVYGQPWTEEGRKKFHETLASAPKGRSLNMTAEDAAFVKSVIKNRMR